MNLYYVALSISIFLIFTWITTLCFFRRAGSITGVIVDIVITILIVLATITVFFIWRQNNSLTKDSIMQIDEPLSSEENDESLKKSNPIDEAILNSTIQKSAYSFCRNKYGSRVN